MSTKVFFISDLHLGHLKALEFRPFNTLEEHDQHIIDCWNSVVRPSDVVWVLGDVALNRDSLKKIDQCNGRKKLVLGNHDLYPIEEYQKWFTHIMAVRRAYHGLVLSHVPIHPCQLEYRWKANIHGHIHNEKEYDLGKGYVNVCCESVNYTPVTLEWVKSRVLEEL